MAAQYHIVFFKILCIANVIIVIITIELFHNGQALSLVYPLPSIFNMHYVKKCIFI